VRVPEGYRLFDPVRIVADRAGRLRRHLTSR
jgi:hypothetical protein